MATIEERAESYIETSGWVVVKDADGNCDVDASINLAKKIGYIKGATAQKFIDIEKACVAYCKVCGHRQEITLPDDCRKDCLRYEAFHKALTEQ